MPARAQTPIPVANVTRAAPVSFEKDILPIFRKNCLACHSASEAYGELVLETPAATLKGGDTAPGVIPGNGAGSLLLKVAAHQQEPIMPPEDNDVAAKPLTPQELGLIKLWIDQGAKGEALGGIISPQNWRPLPPGTHPIYAAAITADGQFAACGRANQIFIYHVPTGQLITRLTDPALQAASRDKRPGLAHLDVVQSLAFNREGDLLASGGFRTVKLWRFPRDVQRLKLAAAGDAVTAAAVSSDRKILATGAADNSIKLWNLQTGELGLTLAGHTAAVHGLRFSWDDSRLVSASADKTVRVWSVAHGQLVGRIDTPTELSSLTTIVLPLPQENADGRPSGQPASDAAEGTADRPRQVLEQIATGGGDNVIRLWNLPESLPQSLADVPAQANVLAVSPDGRAPAIAAGGSPESIVTASADATVQSWRLSAVRQLVGHSQPVTSLVTRTSGPTPEIVSGSSDGTVRRWNITTGQVIQQLNHGGPVTAVAVRADGERIASASANNTAKLWNVAGGQQLAEMRGDLRAKALVAKLTEQKTAATAKVAAAKQVVDAAEKDLPTKTTAEKTAADALAAAKKDVAEKTAALTAASTAKAQAEQAAIQAAASAQEAAREMQQLKEIAVAAAEKAKLLAEKAAQVRAAAQADPSNEALAQAAEAASMTAGAADAEAKAAESATTAPVQAAASAAKTASDAAGKAVAMSKPFTDAATALAKAEATLQSATQAQAVASRDLEQAAAAVPAAKEELAKVEAILKQIDGDLTAATKAEADAQQPLRAIAFSPDGRTLVTGGDLGVVHSWDSDTGQAVTSYVGHTGPIFALAYASDDELVSGSADKSAALWNVNPSWQLERVIGDIADPSVFVDRVVAVDFSDDGRLLATGGGVPSRSGEIKIFNVADGSLVHAIPEAHTDCVNAVEFSPDGLFLASAASDKYVKKFDVATGTQLIQMEGHTEHVLGVSWRAGGRMLASCGADGTIRTWNAETGDRIRRIEGYTKQVTALRFIGQSQFLVSSSGDRIVRMHNSDNGGVQRNFGGCADYMYCVDVTPNPNAGFLVAGGHDGLLRIWNVANAQVLHTIGPPEAR
jgi:WD40 repeat protein